MSFGSLRSFILASHFPTNAGNRLRAGSSCTRVGFVSPTLVDVPIVPGVGVTVFVYVLDGTYPPAPDGDVVVVAGYGTVYVRAILDITPDGVVAVCVTVVVPATRVYTGHVYVPDGDTVHATVVVPVGLDTVCDTVVPVVYGVMTPVDAGRVPATAGPVGASVEPESVGTGVVGATSVAIVVTGVESPPTVAVVTIVLVPVASTGAGHAYVPPDTAHGAVYTSPVPVVTVIDTVDPVDTVPVGAIDAVGPGRAITVGLPIGLVTATDGAVGTGTI
jgi:hypothetical protein